MMRHFWLNSIKKRAQNQTFESLIEPLTFFDNEIKNISCFIEIPYGNRKYSTLK